MNDRHVALKLDYYERSAIRKTLWRILEGFQYNIQLNEQTKIFTIQANLPIDK